MRNRFAAAVVLVALIALRANAQDAERLPVPEAEAVAAEVRIVQQAFEGEYADAANGDATRLISTLLGAEPKAKSAERRYALWQEAERTAGLAGNVEQCLDIVRRKAIVFEIDAIRAASNGHIPESSLVRSRHTNSHPNPQPAKTAMPTIASFVGACAVPTAPVTNAIPTIAITIPMYAISEGRSPKNNPAPTGREALTTAASGATTVIEPFANA